MCMDLEWCIGQSGRLSCQLVGLQDHVDCRSRPLSNHVGNRMRCTSEVVSQGCVVSVGSKTANTFPSMYMRAVVPFVFVCLCLDRDSGDLSFVVSWLWY